MASETEGSRAKLIENLESLRLDRKEAEMVRTALKYYQAQASKGRLTIYEGTYKELDDLTNRLSNAIIGTMIERVSK